MESVTRMSLATQLCTMAPLDTFDSAMQCKDTSSKGLQKASMSFGIFQGCIQHWCKQFYVVTEFRQGVPRLEWKLGDCNAAV